MNPVNERTSNRLIHETSPYLLQHAYNPVDWYPWGEDACAAAKAEGKPLLLSCGYSACHWCHVMERESFENPEIAALMNKYFINVKVDREERPDIDRIYQQAVQMLTGQGGWPLTVFMDHEGRPFFGGTYFPPTAYYNRPGFPDVLQAIHELWARGAGEIEKVSTELMSHLEPETETAPGAGAVPERELPLKALDALGQTIDRRYGGFGGAPKFPTPVLLELFLRVGVRHDQPEAVESILFTLRQMARGGIYDHLGGGFHRYAVDARWLVPHFEKMLYDNAQLLKLYALGYQITNEEEFKNTAQKTADYLRREMTSSEGGFFAAQDADSDGVEGAFFVWGWEEIEEWLDSETADLVREYFNMSKEGNFEEKNILNRLEREGNDADLSPESRKKLQQAKATLFTAREERIKPFRDEKIITSWNGLMIGAFAYAYQVWANPLDYRSAKRAAEFVWNHLRITGPSEEVGLLRIYKDGRAKVEGLLDDYAFMAQGLMNLYEADFRAEWLNQALVLTRAAITRFGRGDGYYFLTPESTGLVVRPGSGRDEAIPSGISIHCENLLRLATMTGDKDLWIEASKILTTYGSQMERDFWGYAGLIGSLDIYHEQWREFTFVSEGPAIPELLVRMRKLFLPYRILVWKNETDRGKEADHPARVLLEGRETKDGQPTCYVCYNQACLPPVTEWEDIYLYCSKNYHHLWRQNAELASHVGTKRY